MVYQLVSVHTIISSIVRKLNIGDAEVRWQDFIEEMAEGLVQIGSYYQFTEKFACIDIEDYKGELPCDFYKLIRITDHKLYLRNNQTIIGDENQINRNKYTNRDINITHNNITVSFRNGKLELLYLAIPVDADGFPLVPDDPSFTNALFWKVCCMLSLQGFAFKNPQLKNYDYCKRKWDFYCIQARATANMPDPDMTERLKNNFLRLKTDPNQYLKYFATNGLPETLRLGGIL